MEDNEVQEPRAEGGGDQQVVGEGEIFDRVTVAQLLRDNRRLQEALLDQQRRTADQTERMTEVLTQVTGLFNATGQARAIQPALAETKVSKVALELVPNYGGNRSEDAREWVQTLEEVGHTHDWRLPHHRKAAICKLTGTAREWHLSQGVQHAEWEPWRAAFLATFGYVLTLEQWSREISGRIRAHGETIVGYSFAKLRICRRCPAHLVDVEIIRHLVLGMNDEIAEPVVLAARPKSITAYMQIARELDEFTREKEARNVSCSPYVQPINIKPPTLINVNPFPQTFTTVAQPTNSAYAALLAHPIAIQYQSHTHSAAATSARNQVPTAAQNHVHFAPSVPPPANAQPTLTSVQGTAGRRGSFSNETDPTSRLGRLVGQMEKVFSDVKLEKGERSEWKRTDSPKCWRCNNLGHIASYCPEIQQSENE